MNAGKSSIAFVDVTDAPAARRRPRTGSALEAGRNIDLDTALEGYQARGAEHEWNRLSLLFWTLLAFENPSTCWRRRTKLHIGVKLARHLKLRGSTDSLAARSAAASAKIGRHAQVARSFAPIFDRCRQQDRRPEAPAASPLGRLRIEIEFLLAVRHWFALPLGPSGLGEVELIS